ncbi:MAG: helix-turn-helix domain-containing protein [Bacteroidales bacterium]|nr:helix-turn-helix domain-containing protein [Bacteroidales bacterium]
MIQVLNRAFNILEYIASDSDKKFGLAEIADSLLLNHSTCANIIKTMLSREYIEQMGRRGGYRLGPKAYYLTGNFPFKKELLSISVELMKNLRSKLNEGIILAIMQNNKRILLHEEHSTHELQVVNHKEKEIYKTSTGRMILACMSRSDQEAYIKKYGLPDEDSWPEIENEEVFFNELIKIRKKQIAVHVAKSDIVGIAVPVFIKNTIVASLGVYLPETRFTKEAQEKIYRDLPITADKVMKGLELIQS